MRCRIPQMEEGRIPFEDRPKPGEVWCFYWAIVYITYCDPYGRWFHYERAAEDTGGEVVVGRIGQSDVLDDNAWRVHA